MSGPDLCGSGVQSSEAVLFKEWLFFFSAEGEKGELDLDLHLNLDLRERKRGVYHRTDVFALFLICRFGDSGQKEKERVGSGFFAGKSTILLAFLF